MPKTGIKHDFELATRNDFTKVNAELSLTVDGRELPTMSAIGEALEEAVTLIQKSIKESFNVVPSRV